MKCDQCKNNYNALLVSDYFPDKRLCNFCYNNLMDDEVRKYVCRFCGKTKIGKEMKYKNEDCDPGDGCWGGNSLSCCKECFKYSSVQKYCQIELSITWDNPMDSLTDVEKMELEQLKQQDEN